MRPGRTKTTSFSLDDTTMKNLKLLARRRHKGNVSALLSEVAAREAKFAAAMDRFQPVLQNCLTQGAAWRQNGITSDRVIARNRHIADGATEVWTYAAQMIADAIKDGHLPK